MLATRGTEVGKVVVPQQTPVASTRIGAGLSYVNTQYPQCGPTPILTVSILGVLDQGKWGLEVRFFAVYSKQERAGLNTPSPIRPSLARLRNPPER